MIIHMSFILYTKINQTYFGKEEFSVFIHVEFSDMQLAERTCFRKEVRQEVDQQ